MKMGMEAYNGLFLIGFGIAMVAVIGVLWLGFKKIKDNEDKE
jgi:hypothetical protein